jgi:hypothetical protein
LRAALLRYGGSRVVVINVPWYLQEPHIQEGLEQEELLGREGKRSTAR